MLLPVSGQTKLHVRVYEWKLRVKKEFWKDAGEIDLTAIPDVDLAALGQISRGGGTLEVCLDGGVKMNDTITLWNWDKFADAEVSIVRPEGDIIGVYDDKQDLYAFNIPSAGGEPASARARAQVRVEVWPEDATHNRLRELARRAKENDLLLDSKLADDAETFIAAALEYLAGTDRATLIQQGTRFTNATHAVTYFQGYTTLTAKAFKTALDLHALAYERYMENMVAGVMEFLFWLGIPTSRPSQ